MIGKKIKKFNIWEGVYDTFSDVPVYGDGFDGERWISRSLIKIKDLIKCSNENDKIHFVDLPLYSIAADIYAKKNKVKILDFGGGMGNGFIPLCTTLPDSDNLSFTIIEGKKVVGNAEKLFINDNRINFLTELPENNKYDIIHIGSSLQYIEKWVSLIGKLSTYNAKYFVFTDLPAGDIDRTYVSSQNYYESKIACLFFKLKDIIDTMSKNNYELIYKSNFQANISEINRHYPQDNFHKEYRINYSKTLVFKL